MFSNRPKIKNCSLSNIKHLSIKSVYFLFFYVFNWCVVFLCVASVVVFAFVVFKQRRTRKVPVKKPAPEYDVRENIISYDDEGGGEDDMMAFDMKPLQVPIGGPAPLPELLQCKLPIMCK